MTSDIIEKFYEIVKPYCDAPDSFILGGGYYLVSDLLGRFFRCSQMPFGSEGGRPNFWYLMSSIPGRMRRSSVQRYVGTVLRHASMYYYQAQEMVPPEANTDEWEELDDRARAKRVMRCRFM